MTKYRAPSQLAHEGNPTYVSHSGQEIKRSPPPHQGKQRTCPDSPKAGARAQGKPCKRAPVPPPAPKGKGTKNAEYKEPKLEESATQGALHALQCVKKNIMSAQEELRRKMTKEERKGRPQTRGSIGEQSCPITDPSNPEDQPSFRSLQTGPRRGQGSGWEAVTQAGDDSSTVSMALVGFWVVSWNPKNGHDREAGEL